MLKESHEAQPEQQDSSKFGSMDSRGLIDLEIQESPLLYNDLRQSPDPMMIMSDHDSKQAVEYLSQLRSSLHKQQINNEHDLSASAEISLRVQEKND